MSTKKGTTLEVRDTQGRPLGSIAYRPGIVRSGNLAAVSTPGGIVLRRVYYYREGGREMVRLVSTLSSIAPLCYPLAEVSIMGALLDCASAANVRKGGAR